jgi:HlyD family secretion protein
MKEKIKNLWSRLSLYISNIKTWPLKKKIIRGVVLLVILLIIWNVVKPKTIDPDLITVVPVETKDLISTVKSSGSVTSVTDLNLSFKTSDLVQTVNVKVGDKVYKGQVLATLKNGNELGSVTQARASLASAQAQLAKTIEGSTTEEVKIAEVTLQNAKDSLNSTKRSQDILVNNARQTLYSSSLSAISTFTNSSTSTPTITGIYRGNDPTEYTINPSATGGGGYATFSSTNGDSGIININTNSPIALGKYGLFINFPASVGYNESWKVVIPNTASTSYSTNLSLYNNAIENRDSAVQLAQGSVDSAQANLDLKKAAARPVDIDLKQAEVLRAQGQLQSALGSYENTVIRAPADGTVTKMDLKNGELAKALETVIVVQDVSKLYVESNINESNITEVAIDQKVDLTIDAYGPNEYFTGTVTQVEPGATITDGIVNYKIKVSLDEKDKKVKPGMNANLVITTGQKNGVLAIPNAAVNKRDNKNYVLVITNEKKKSYKEVPVTTGIIGSGNLVEIVSGLNVGEKVALVEKS